MDSEVKATIYLIGTWLLESISANDLDRLIDHMNTQRLESDRKYNVANELATAMGYEAFD